METKCILVVDDDPPILELVKLVFEMRQYKVLTAPDGKSAIDTIIQLQPDLVILDIMLPEVNGLSICKFIKGDEALKKIKVIMFSSKSLDTDKQKAREVGADAYLTKPLVMNDLLDKVNELLYKI